MDSRKCNERDLQKLLRILKKMYKGIKTWISKPVGITSIRYAYIRKTGKPNNIKTFSSKKAKDLNRIAKIS